MEINTEGYDFLDLGAGNGESIEFAIDRFKVKRGIGIDIDPEKVKTAREKGYDVILGDITKIPEMQKAVKFVTMVHFLEHMEGFRMAEKIIQRAVDTARDFVYIRQPFFDSNSYLLKKGFKHYWADWCFHSFHMTSFDIYRILMPLQLQSKIVGFVIFGNMPTITSYDSHIHPLQSDSDQLHYDSKKHPPKYNDVIFRNVFKELEVFVLIKSNEELTDYYINGSNDGMDRKLLFDSNHMLMDIKENVRTPESGHVGKIIAGREIKQGISIPNDLDFKKKLYIEILMATFCRNNYGKIEIHIKQDNLHDKVSISTLKIEDNKYHKIIFDKIHLRKGNALIILKGINGTNDNSVTAYLTEDAPWGGAIVDNKSINESLVIKTYVH